MKAGEIQLAPSKGSPHRPHGRLTQRDASSSISSASGKPAAKTKTLRARRQHLRASHRGFNVTQTHGRLCTRGLGVKRAMETPAGVQAHSNGRAGRGGKGPGHPARFRASANLGPLYRRVGAGGHSSASRGFRLHEFCDGSSRARPPLLQNAPSPSRFSHEPRGRAAPPVLRCAHGRVLVPRRYCSTNAGLPFGSLEARMSHGGQRGCGSKSCFLERCLVEGRARKGSVPPHPGRLAPADGP